MVTTDLSVSDTLLGTCNFGSTEVFFLQLINFQVTSRKKKSVFFLKVEILTPPEKSKKVKICQNLSVLPKLCLLLAVLTIIGTSSSFGLFRKMYIAAKWVILSYELLKFG